MSFFRIYIFRINDCRKVYHGSSLCNLLFFHAQTVCSSHHLVNCPKSEFGHDLPHFFCDIGHEVHHIFRLTFKAFSEALILCRNTNRTGILIADTHHHAAHRNKRCCRKTIFLCTKHCCNNNISAAHQLTVCLQNDPVAQTIFNQCLMCFCYSKFPRKSCIVDGTDRCRSCTAIITGYQYDLRTGLCNSGCNCPDSCL